MSADGGQGENQNLKPVADRIYCFLSIPVQLIIKTNAQCPPKRKETLEQNNKCIINEKAISIIELKYKT